MNQDVLSITETVVADTDPVRYDVTFDVRNSSVSQDEIRSYIQDYYCDPRLLCFPPDTDIGYVITSEEGDLVHVVLHYTIYQWATDRLEETEETEETKYN